MYYGDNVFKKARKWIRDKTSGLAEDKFNLYWEIRRDGDISLSGKDYCISLVAEGTSMLRCNISLFEPFRAFLLLNILEIFLETFGVFPCFKWRFFLGHFQAFSLKHFEAFSFSWAIYRGYKSRKTTCYVQTGFRLQHHSTDVQHGIAQCYS